MGEVEDVGLSGIHRRSISAGGETWIGIQPAFTDTVTILTRGRFSIDADITITNRPLLWTEEESADTKQAGYSAQLDQEEQQW